MGSCQTSNVIEIKPADKSKPKSKISNEEFQNIESQKKMFPDMKEWSGERYSGIGIKRLKGYKCDLPIDKLIEKRDEFWGFKNSHSNPNYRTWRIINQAVVYDEYRANVLLEQYELTTAEGCINHIIDKKGNHYIIPNYCINEPYFEKSYKIDKNVKEEIIKIRMFEPSDNVNLELKVSNLLTGNELKEKYKKKSKGDFSKFNIRLFLAGQEIKDDHFLYQHNIKSDYKIQVMKLPKIENKDNEINKYNKNNEIIDDDDDDDIFN